MNYLDEQEDAREVWRLLYQFAGMLVLAILAASAVVSAAVGLVSLCGWMLWKALS